MKRVQSLALLRSQLILGLASRAEYSTFSSCAIPRQEGHTLMPMHDDSASNWRSHFEPNLGFGWQHYHSSASTGISSNVGSVGPQIKLKKIPKGSKYSKEYIVHGIYEVFQDHRRLTNMFIVCTLVGYFLKVYFEYFGYLFIEEYGMDNLLLKENYARIFYYSLMHNSFLHLVADLVALEVTASPLNLKMGEKRLLLMGFMASMAGAFTFNAFGPSDGFMVGSTTVAASFLGAMLANQFDNRKFFPVQLEKLQRPAAAVAASCVISCWLFGLEAMWGHAGGFISGALLMLIMGPRYRLNDTGFPENKPRLKVFKRSKFNV